MSLSNNMEEYYQRVIQLQERLRQSEEERLKLEMKFNEMLQVMKEEEEAHFKKLRSKYKQFLEEDRRRQQRNDKILEALDRIENRAAIWEARTEKFKAFRKKYRSYLKPGCNEQRSRSPLDSERTHPDLKYDKYKPVDEKFDYQKRDKKEESQPNKSENGIMERYLQSLSSERCKEDILQRKKDPPESKYSNLGNINSIYTRPSEKNEKKDFEKIRRFDNDDFTQSKSTKDMENALKQNYSRSDDGGDDEGDDDSVGYRRNDYSYLDFEKKPQEDYGKYAISEKPKPKSFAASNDDDTNPYGKSLGQQIKFSDQPRDTPKQAHNDLEKLIKEHKEPVPIQLNEGLQSSAPTASKSEIQPTPTQQQIKATPQEISNSISNFTVAKPINSQLPLSEERVNQENANINPRELVQQAQAQSIEGSLSKTEHFESVPQRRLSKILNLDGQPEELPASPKNSIQKDEEKIPITDGQDLIGSKEIIREEIPKEEPDQDKQPPPQSEEIEEKPLQKDNINNEQPQEPVTQYHEETNQYNMQQQYYNENGQPIPTQYDENSQPLPTQYDENGQPLPTLYDEDSQFQPAQYDESGQPLATNQYDENGQPLQAYDGSSQQLQQYDENGQPIVQYDENGQPIQYYPEGEQLQSQYYDDNGQPLQQYYDNTGQQMQGYDENGQPIVQYDENGQPLMQYDENGQPVVQYNENGEPLNQYYDENGQYYQENPQQAYDENGQPIQEQYTDEAYQQQQYYEQQQQLQQEGIIEPSSLSQEAEQLNDEGKSNVLNMLETDTESAKQDTKISNDSDFDLSNA